MTFQAAVGYSWIFEYCLVEPQMRKKNAKENTEDIFNTEKMYSKDWNFKGNFDLRFQFFLSAHSG